MLIFGRLSNDHVDNVDDLFKVQEKLHETGLFFANLFILSALTVFLRRAQFSFCQHSAYTSVTR
jgi:hypothetical protein